MDPDNKPTREDLKEEVLKVSKGLVGLGGFNLVSSCRNGNYSDVGHSLETGG